MSGSPIADRVIQAADADPRSDRAISKAAGLNDTFLRDVRNDRSREPKRESVVKLAEALKVRPQWLLDGNRPKYSKGGKSVTDQIAAESETLDDDEQVFVLEMIRRLKSTSDVA